MLCKVLNGGSIRNDSNVFIPDYKPKTPFLTSEAKDDILLANTLGVDFIALSASSDDSITVYTGDERIRRPLVMICGHFRIAYRAGGGSYIDILDTRAFGNGGSEVLCSLVAMSTIISAVRADVFIYQFAQEISK